MGTKEHWEKVYGNKAADTVSWYQPHATLSLQWIRASGVAREAPLIDVGGGASTLVDDLVDEGFTAVHVLDLSAAALAAAQTRLDARAAAVRWHVADVTKTEFPPGTFALWHDRAVFHFLVETALRQAYVRALTRALRDGGHLIIATFAEDGPTQCSGLPVQRYSAEGLQAVFGARFTLVNQARETHRTPGGAEQRFVYCHFRKEERGA